MKSGDRESGDRESVDSRSGEGRPIITVTLNPALDVSSSVQVVTPEHKLRCDAAIREPGGGGINVARVATRLGADVSAVTVVGGSVGRQLMELVAAEGIRAQSVSHRGETRESVSISERSTGHQFRFVMPGPALDVAVIDEVSRVLTTLFEQLGGDRITPIVVVSGSVPTGTDAGSLTRLINSLAPATIVVDTSGPALVEALDTAVELVKPSARELQSVVGRELRDEAEVLGAAQEIFAASPVRSLLVSIGAGGAVLLERGRPIRRLRAPTVRVRSAIGAGDSLVAGVAAGLARGYDIGRAAALGIAAGTATVMTPGTGLCAATDVESLLPMVASANA